MIAPESVDAGTIDRFITELNATTLIRNISRPGPYASRKRGMLL